jgi:hypothetical protein
MNLNILKYLWKIKMNFIQNLDDIELNIKIKLNK